MFKGHFGAKAGFNENLLPSTVSIINIITIVPPFTTCVPHLWSLLLPHSQNPDKCSCLPVHRNTAKLRTLNCLTQDLLSTGGTA